MNEFLLLALQTHRCSVPNGTNQLELKLIPQAQSTEFRQQEASKEIRGKEKVQNVCMVGYLFLRLAPFVVVWMAKRSHTAHSHTLIIPSTSLTRLNILPGSVAAHPMPVYC